MAKSKSTKSKKKAPKAAKTADSPTLAAVAEADLAALEQAGKSESTACSYRQDLRVALGELGAETKVGELTPERIAAYFDSPAVTETRAGKKKAKPTVAKTRRVLRLALVWAAETGLIDHAPLPQPEPSAKS